MDNVIITPFRELATKNTPPHHKKLFYFIDYSIALMSLASIIALITIFYINFKNETISVSEIKSTKGFTLDLKVTCLYSITCQVINKYDTKECKKYNVNETIQQNDTLKVTICGENVQYPSYDGGLSIMIGIKDFGGELNVYEPATIDVGNVTHYLSNVLTARKIDPISIDYILNDKEEIVKFTQNVGFDANIQVAYCNQHYPHSTVSRCGIKRYRLTETYTKISTQSAVQASDFIANCLAVLGIWKLGYILSTFTKITIRYFDSYDENAERLEMELERLEEILSHKKVVEFSAEGPLNTAKRYDIIETDGQLNLETINENSSNVDQFAQTIRNETPMIETINPEQENIQTIINFNASDQISEEARRPTNIAKRKSNLVTLQPQDQIETSYYSVDYNDKDSPESKEVNLSTILPNQITTEHTIVDIDQEQMETVR